MRRRTRLILEGVGPFVAIGLVFGMLYNTLFYPRTLIEYVEAGTISVIIGIAAGLAEQVPALRRWMQRLSLPRALAVRTLAYSSAVALILSFVLSIEPATLGQCTYLACVVDYIRGPLFVRDLVYSTAFVFIVSFLGQIVLLVGTRNLGRLVAGRYRQPREVRAVFMFVDLRNSTGIAEALGHERYSAFLRDFFTDASDAIHEHEGEVYQYIGDEIIVVWHAGRSPDRWLDCYHAMRAAVERRRSHYDAHFGIVPEFKAGVHAGEAIVTEVGTLQRALVYHGDVLNTAARLRSLCTETGAPVLASRAALALLDPAQRAGFTPLDALPLRGKTEAVEMFALGAHAPQPEAEHQDHVSA